MKYDLTQGALIEVLWKDANHVCDNTEVKHNFESSKLKSVGWFVRWTKEGDLLMTAEMDTQDKEWVRHVSLIPIGMIADLWEISYETRNNNRKAKRTVRSRSRR